MSRSEENKTENARGSYYGLSGIVKAPSPAAIFPEWTGDDLDLTYVSDEKSSFLAYAYIHALAGLKTGLGAFANGEATANVYLQKITEMANKDTEQGVSIRKNLAEGGQAVAIIGLIQAAKKKPLETDNMNGYYQSLGCNGMSVSKLTKLINDVAIFHPDITGTDEYKEIRYNSTWQDYRESRASWGNLFKRCRTDLIAYGMITAERAQRLANCSMFDPDQIAEITPKELVIIRAYLDAADGLPKEWPQGDKAYKLFNKRIYNTMVKAFKKRFELAADVEALEAAETTEAVDEILRTF